MALDVNHKRFLQFMMKHGSVGVDKAEAYYDSLHEGAEEEQAAPLSRAVSKINKLIKHQHFKIATATCEVTDKELLIFLNLSNDNFENLQVAHAPIQCEYFRTILHEIVVAKQHRLPHMTCLNLASTLTSSLARSEGQDLLEKWTLDGYLVSSDNHIYLGARAVQEFKLHFQSECKDYITDCNLCSEPVFMGKRCHPCKTEMHSRCLKKFSHNSNMCPHCKTNLDEQPESESDSE